MTNQDEVLTLMAAAARTAPKTKGYDDITIKPTKDNNGLIIGVDASKPDGVNCGLCGTKDCIDFSKTRKTRPVNCIFKITDLGLAVSSAIDIAKKHNQIPKTTYLKDYKLNNCSMVVKIENEIPKTTDKE